MDHVVVPLHSQAPAEILRWAAGWRELMVRVEPVRRVGWQQSAETLDHHNEDFDTLDTLQMAVRVVDRVCKVEGISTSPDAQLDVSALPEVEALDISGDILDELHTVIMEGMTSDFSG